MASGADQERAFLRRWRRRRVLLQSSIMVLGLTPSVVNLARMLLRPGRPPPPVWAFGIFCGSFVLVGAALAVVRWRGERRLRERLRVQGYRVCIGCGYTLNREHDGQPCPECGVRVDLTECRRAWSKFLWGRDDAGPP